MYGVKPVPFTEARLPFTEARLPDCVELWSLGILIWQLIEEHHVEQRLMYSDTTVVLNKTKFAEAIHEEADARSSGADHLSQCFLCNGWNKCLRLTGFAKFCHQKKN